MRLIRDMWNLVLISSRSVVIVDDGGKGSQQHTNDYRVIIIHLGYSKRSYFNISILDSGAIRQRPRTPVLRMICHLILPSIHIAESLHLLVRHVRIVHVSSLICGETLNTSFAISLQVLPNQVYAKDETQDKCCATAYHHGEEARRVAGCFIGEEQLWADDVACTIGDKDL